jgi:short-subunit dehydrogenase
LAQVEGELGGVDILVNNAATALSGDATTTPWDQIEYITHLDYLSPVKLTTAALPAMLQRQSGHVVTISSMAARMSTPGEAAYAGTKAALAAYFEALASELWDTSIGIHLVYPALIDLTPGVDGDDTLALTTDGATPIPAPVCAREIRRQLERGDLQLYVPETMRRLVAQRATDLEKSIELMAGWYRAGLS